MSELGFKYYKQRGRTETGSQFKVSSERPEKRVIDLVIPGSVVKRVIHYTAAAPFEGWKHLKLAFGHLLGKINLCRSYINSGNSCIITVPKPFIRILPSPTDLRRTLL